LGVNRNEGRGKKPRPSFSILFSCCSYFTVRTIVVLCVMAVMPLLDRPAMVTV
jgi:hypothetical protein